MKHFTRLQKRILYIFGATTLLLMAGIHTTVAGLSIPPEQVTICHKPTTPAEKTLTLPGTAIEGHLGHGDRLGACEVLPHCNQPPTPPLVDVGTEPNEDEQEWISGSVATLENASETGLTPTGAPITFQLSCNTLNTGADSVIVYDNGLPLPYDALTLTDNSVSLTNGLSSGRHQVELLAQDVFGFTIKKRVVLWVGNFNIPVLVINETGAPVANAEVVAKLSDDPEVIATLITDATGQGTFTNLPNRSYNIVASTSDNLIATRPASVFDGLVTLQLLGFNPPSTIDNNDFSQGTAGWEIGSAPVSIVPHIETLSLISTQSATALKTTDTGTTATRLPRTPESSALLAPALVTTAAITAAAEPDFDLRLTTSGEGQQKISRTFEVEDGVKSITVRYRFITSEVPGGWFGSEFNDFYNVSIRTVKAGGSVKAGNSMNGLGLAAFDANGATGWVETELAVAEGGDTVQVDIAVANVADQYFNSQVIVDGIKKKKLTISSLQLNDIDNSGLQYLSASNHNYFNSQTRVHGTITIKGPKDDTLEELKVEVIEGGTIATGTLNPALTGTLYRTFGDTEEIRIDASQLLFEIPASQLATANQGTNGALTLRVKARSSSDETAEKDFGPVTKLTRFTGGNRYGGRDGAVGGDDWAKPGVRAFIDTAGLIWGDFSNMNGGSFAPDHQTHQTGNSADGWFAGYNARNAATAATIIGQLNTHGTRISTVYVTFGAQSEFANAINGVTLNDGRAATDIIRNIGGHTTHFHWEVTE